MLFSAFVTLAVFRDLTNILAFQVCSECTTPPPTCCPIVTLEFVKALEPVVKEHNWKANEPEEKISNQQGKWKAMSL